MIIPRQKTFSWKSAVKAIEHDFGKGTSRADYELYWTKHRRDRIAKELKNARKASDVSPDEVRELAKKRKINLAQDWYDCYWSKDSALKAANLKK